MSDTAFNTEIHKIMHNALTGQRITATEAVNDKNSNRRLTNTCTAIKVTTLYIVHVFMFALRVL